MIRRVNFPLTIGESQNFRLVFVDFDVGAIGKSPLFDGFLGPVGVCDAYGTVGVVNFVGAVFETVFDLPTEEKKNRLIGKVEELQIFQLTLDTQGFQDRRCTLCAMCLSHCNNI